MFWLRTVEWLIIRRDKEGGQWLYRKGGQWLYRKGVMYICSGGGVVGQQIRWRVCICVLVKLIQQYLIMKLAIDDLCKEQFKKLKFQKKYRFIIYKIQAEKVVIDQIGEKEQNWESFVKKLPAAQYRFCVFDLEFENKDNMKVSKIFFCGWFPDAAKIKVKMLYATAKESFRSYLDLNGKDIYITTYDELNHNDLIKQFDK